MIPYKRLTYIIWGVVFFMLLGSTLSLAQEGASAEAQGGEPYLPIVIGKGVSSDNANATTKGPQEIRVDKLASGDRIAIGKKVEGGCQFEPMDLTIEKGQWVAYVADEACNLILDSRWSGTIKNAPEHLKKFVDKAEPEGFEVVAQGVSSQNNSAEQGSQGNVMAATVTCQTHSNVVLTYGGGGLADELTKLTGWIEACKDGAGSFVSGSYGGTCWAATWPPSWDWVIDSCTKYGFELQSWTVAGQERGDYHCGPTNVFPCNVSNPDGYYHSLYLSQRAYSGGSAYCTRSASGSYVFGPWGYNIQGCY